MCNQYEGSSLHLDSNEPRAASEREGFELRSRKTLSFRPHHRSQRHGTPGHLLLLLLLRLTLLPSLQHGIKRSRVPPVPDSAEVERKKREKEAKRIEEYTGLVSALREKVSCLRWSATARADELRADPAVTSRSLVLDARCCSWIPRTIARRRYSSQPRFWRSIQSIKQPGASGDACCSK
jgi:hypothetical protein